MLVEVSEVYHTEDESKEDAADAALIHHILAQHLPSGFVAEDAPADPPPLTVADVVARLQVDQAIRGRIRQEVMAVIQGLRQATIPLPDNLSQRGVRQLFERLGLTVSERVQEVFREAAIFLAMGRRQNMTRLAATRRQRRANPPRPDDEETSR